MALFIFLIFNFRTMSGTKYSEADVAKAVAQVRAGMSVRKANMAFEVKHFMPPK